MFDYKKTIDKHKKRLLNMENVVGIGYGVKEKRGEKTGDEAIVVLVEKKLPPRKLKNKDLVPQRLEDYQTDVIEIGKIEFLAERTERLRPAQPGISIGHYKISAGTLGAIVKDKKTGNPLLLSNNHVLANISNGIDNRAAIGDPVLQPGAYDNGKNPEDIIGYLERFIPIKRGEGEPQCKIALMTEKIANFLVHLIRPNYNLKFVKSEGTNLVDCAVARPKSPEMIKKAILEIGEVKGTREPEIDLPVQKSGRTSGLTTGKIVSIGATLTVNMSETEKAIFEDQFVTTPISKAGDSGSLVLDLKNYATGLLFAGSDKATVCNRITNVLELLEVEF